MKSLGGAEFTVLLGAKRQNRRIHVRSKKSKLKWAVQEFDVKVLKGMVKYLVSPEHSHLRWYSLTKHKTSCPAVSAELLIESFRTSCPHVERTLRAGGHFGEIPAFGV